jgi:hypothetical protein
MNFALSCYLQQIIKNLKTGGLNEPSYIGPPDLLPTTDRCLETATLIRDAIEPISCINNYALQTINNQRNG